MRKATIFLSGGYKYSTSINGSNPEIQKYFALGSLINIGTVEDDLRTIEALTIEN